MLAILGICIGASLGALLRWVLALQFNPVFAHIPLGTLASNLLGGYLVGVAVAFFAQHTSIAPEWRLFAITGFLGGLTTFSTFSAEAVVLLQTGRIAWACAMISAHVVGSLLMTLLGIASLSALQSR